MKNSESLDVKRAQERKKPTQASQMATFSSWSEMEQNRPFLAESSLCATNRHSRPLGRIIANRICPGISINRILSKLIKMCKKYFSRILFLPPRSKGGADLRGVKIVNIFHFFHSKNFLGIVFLLSLYLKLKIL